MRRAEIDIALLPWGRDVRVSRKPGPFGSELLVLETEALNPDEPIPVVSEEVRSTTENLLPVLLSPDSNWGNPDRTTTEPHLRFASADTDEKLIAFLKDFGPVLGWTDLPDERDRVDPEDLVNDHKMADRSSAADGQSTVDAERMRSQGAKEELRSLRRASRSRSGNRRALAEENLAELRAERERFAALLKLISLLKEPVFDRKAVLEAEKEVEQRYRTLHGRPDFSGPIRIRGGRGFTDVSLEEAVLLNLLTELEPYRFRLEILSMGRMARPKLCVMPNRAGRGFRGILYGLLVRELEGPALSFKCPNPLCGKWFKAERVNQKHCTIACGKRDASNRYYERHGRLRRHARSQARSTT